MADYFTEREKIEAEYASTNTVMADYISRQTVLDDIQHLWDWDTVDGITASTVLKQVMTDIKNVPSADVQPVHYAIWKLFSEYKRHWGKITVKIFYCSHCGHEERIEHRKFDDYDLPNFCSNCGYDMRWVD